MDDDDDDGDDDDEDEDEDEDDDKAWVEGSTGTARSEALFEWAPVEYRNKIKAGYKKSISTSTCNRNITTFIIVFKIYTRTHTRTQVHSLKMWRPVSYAAICVCEWV